MTVQKIFSMCAVAMVVLFAPVAAFAQNCELDKVFLAAAFEAADTSGNGRINEAEYSADVIAAFVSVDRSGNGRLSADELREAGVENPTIDANDDGSVTIVEVMNVKIIEFQNADGDRDGELTLIELQTYECRR